MPSRISRLQERLNGEGIHGMLITSGPNIRYLSGFSGSAGALMVRDGEATLYTDSRYAIQAEEETRGVGVRIVSGVAAAAALSEDRGGGRIAFESEIISVAGHERLRAIMKDGDLVPVDGQVEALREIKEPGEVAAIEASLRVTAEAFEEGARRAVEGATELEVAASIERAMREKGASAPAFESIVGSGPRGALPHARATSRRLARGEPVVVDIGAMVNGYASDMTRTLFVAEADSRGREVHEAVAGAVRRAEEAVRDGIPVSDVDAAAREHLLASTFAEHAYGHGTGHGIGLEVHESPRVAGGRTERLREGMVLTIEPGVYIPGWGGVRIEDVVLVEKEGCRLLTPTPKELRAA